MRKYLAFTFFLLAGNLLLGQSPFVSPLKIPMRLAATFAELRPNHFHMGIDIRTQEVEGKKVYAIADGYISRIKIKRGGYGKAIYITHPNGYTSVYGHLQRFRKDIDDYVKTRQYQKKQNEIELFFPPGKFPLKQNEFFAYSGNTGYSSGPHVHFEIRHTQSEAPVNPLLFFADKVPDKTSPYIGKIKIYPYDSKAFVNNKNTAPEFSVSKQGNHYILKNKDTIQLSGNIYFGINTYDPFNNWRNKNGVYSIKLFINQELIYQHQMDSISYSKNRYVNSLLDYDEYIRLKRKFQRCYIAPGNFLHSIYKTVKNRGIYNFQAGKDYEIRFEVSDIHGNTSQCIFPVKGKNAPHTPKKESKIDRSLIPVRYDRATSIREDSIRITIPQYALYEDINLRLRQRKKRKGMYAPIYSIHRKTVPLQKSCAIKFIIDSIPARLRSKATVVQLGKKGPSSIASKISGDTALFSIREFGDYSLMLDTVPPQLRAINISKNKLVSEKTVLRFRLNDAMSGIKDYQAFLNGNWLLLEYNSRRKELRCPLERYLKEGKNELIISAGDQLNNTVIKKYHFSKKAKTGKEKSKK